ncbi:uncharacterized protein LOC112539778 [Tetranychus urticae]|uniref:Uncharacterized protein n=1 Tax=Tetranychus urticae TaxID=32264 RepID=T1L612_TETUR|nr:uncharacterized protein LOC112539778 [Tetranychus urticae]
MNSQVGPFSLNISILKKIGPIEYVCDAEHVLNESTTFAGFSSHNYTVKTSMPFREVGAISLDWHDHVRIYGNIDDVNIQTAYLTETTPNQPHITKKFCKTDIYPRNLGGNLASTTLSLC